MRHVRLSNNMIAQSVQALMGGVTFGCSIVEMIGVFLYSHMDLGLVHAAVFLARILYTAAGTGYRTCRRVFGVIRSSIRSVLRFVSFVISFITTALWSVLKNLFLAMESVVMACWSTISLGILAIWMNPATSLVLSVIALIVVYLNYTRKIDIYGLVFSVVDASLGWGVAALNRINPVAAVVKDKLAFVGSSLISFLQDNSAMILPRRQQLEGIVHNMNAAVQVGFTMWHAFLTLPSAEDHFRSVCELPHFI